MPVLHVLIRAQTFLSFPDSCVLILYKISPSGRYLSLPVHLKLSSQNMSAIPAHTHEGGRCPVTGASGVNPHTFCPPQEGDSRAPCPAMNTMANHGYLPRDGKMIDADTIVAALMECYRLSKPLASFLTRGALTLLNQGSAPFQLSDLARHNHVEHNASLYHPDAAPREEYAPLHGDPQLLDLVFKDSASGVVMTPEDIARVRVRRELTSNPPLDFIHAELARGEISIVLNMFNNPDPEFHDAKGVPFARRSTLSKIWRALLRRKDDAKTTPLDGVPIERMRYWFEHERLPEDWKPYHVTTLRQTILMANRIRSEMHRLAAQNKKQAKVDATTQKAAIANVSPSTAETKGKVDATSSSSISDSGADDANTLTVPPLFHSRDSTMSSATSSTFGDVLHTPQSSEFMPASIIPSAPSKDVHLIEVRLPEILEHTEPASQKGFGGLNAAPAVEVASS